MYERLVIPTVLQEETLVAIHEGHLGITKCNARARAAVWWPGITKQIEKMVQQCLICAKIRPEPKEPLMALSFEVEPWTRIGTDLFEHQGKNYIVVVDYTSCWIDFRELPNTLSSTIIDTISSVFAAEGIPKVVISDNRPQYLSGEFKEFAKEWGFTHITSSPKHPIGNGEAEHVELDEKLRNVSAWRWKD